ncbi:MAG: acetyl-CoA decarbonylase/synthase complex subunit gamma [Proteobacteria bacterium]|nr:acetyl-CoA decarbonylase/synthase complex subunit gamma [Pseudomonadota bacterium]
MALTGLKIQKYLPKTNCKECGSNTCLAFAMKLAAKKADLSECPYASEEAKQFLGAASEPPVKCVEFGADKTLKLGEETVFYRHEKTFVHQTALAVNVNDTDPPETIEQTLNAIADYTLERVGETLVVDMAAVTQMGDDPERFAAVARNAWEIIKRPLVLRSHDPKALAAAARAVEGSSSLLSSASAETVDELKTVALENGHNLAVTAPDLDGLVSLTAGLKEEGFNDLVLQFETHSLAERFQVNSIARRAALKNNFKALGYPTLSFLKADDPLENSVLAVNEISKFGGICVLPAFDPAQMVSLMTLRMNIYTDPQKPIQVEPKVYPIGDPGPDSPVFVTTNFSLTFFMVSGEIENAGISAWLVVPESEGMSVLTSWAAGKFSGSSIGKFVREIGLESRVTTREIVIPGYVAQISGELEENLPGWKAIVGPQESADLESFIKNVLPTAKN